MKKTLFIIGGAGNIFFQLSKIKSKHENFIISDFFIKDFVRKKINHTSHPPIYRKLFKIEKIQNNVFSLIMLGIDLILCKMLKFTLFSELDLRFLKSKPLIMSILYLGYFQTGVELASIRANKESVFDLLKLSGNHANKNIIHIRGGDFLKENAGLQFIYYSEAIKHSIIKFGGGLYFKIITDDKNHAEKIFADLNIGYEFIGGDAVLDFAIINNSNILICSNSTFAMTAGLTSATVNCIYLPKIFLDKFDNSLPVDKIAIVSL